VLQTATKYLSKREREREREKEIREGFWVLQTATKDPKRVWVSQKATKYTREGGVREFVETRVFTDRNKLTNCIQSLGFRVRNQGLGREGLGFGIKVRGGLAGWKSCSLLYLVSQTSTPCKSLRVMKRRSAAATICVTS
jgi:hypothetical protein